MDLIWRRKKNWICHILRDESLLREVIEGRMIGKRQRREVIEGRMIGKRQRERKRLGMINEFLKDKGGKQE